MNPMIAQQMMANPMLAQQMMMQQAMQQQQLQAQQQMMQKQRMLQAQQMQAQQMQMQQVRAQQLAAQQQQQQEQQQQQQQQQQQAVANSGAGVGVVDPPKLSFGRSNTWSGDTGAPGALASGGASGGTSGGASGRASGAGGLPESREAMVLELDRIRCVLRRVLTKIDRPERPQADQARGAEAAKAEGKAVASGPDSRKAQSKASSSAVDRFGLGVASLKAELGPAAANREGLLAADKAYLERQLSEKTRALDQCLSVVELCELRQQELTDENSALAREKQGLAASLGESEARVRELQAKLARARSEAAEAAEAANLSAKPEAAGAAGEVRALVRPPARTRSRSQAVRKQSPDLGLDPGSSASSQETF